MGQIHILEKKALTLPEVKKIIEKKEGSRIKKTIDYVNKFAKLDIKEINNLREKIKNLGLTRLKDKTIAKIIDIQPKDEDSLRMILSQENLTVKQEDLKKILECLK